jgi:hypothetical protein
MACGRRARLKQDKFTSLYVCPVAMRFAAEPQRESCARAVIAKWADKLSKFRRRDRRRLPVGSAQNSTEIKKDSVVATRYELTRRRHIFRSLVTESAGESHWRMSLRFEHETMD